jgi:hypothetical protein
VVAGCAFVAAAAFFIPRRTWFAWPLALGALFLAGSLHIQARDASRHVDTDIFAFRRWTGSGYRWACDAKWTTRAREFWRDAAGGGY